MTTRQLYELLRAEIKQLEAEHAELLAALRLMVGGIMGDNILKEIGLSDNMKQAVTAAIAAIAKVDGNRKRKR